MKSIVGIEIKNSSCRLGFSYIEFMNQAESINVQTQVSRLVVPNPKFTVLIRLISQQRNTGCV